ncbi:phospholipase D-like domain-containing protein [Paraburkholderia caledonica]|uniref:phospholipase D-like domain-containing protein n=1 Tax=Paraburkholderia caledonica TaxID=134536 RepID=UPI00036EE903|nr:phospholipase D-like domain-containing protein [Paraburkholderia caledonica]
MQAYAHFESIEQEILKLLDRAQISVRICVAWISPVAYQSVFTRLSARGVQIDVIYNDDHINSRSAVNCMQGVQLHPRKARRSALMHNKFCIIDERILITGSYNWSGNAANHFENIVVVEDNFSLINSYLHEFHDLLELDYAQVNQYCPVCRSVTYNVVVLGDESGKHAESQVELWSICTNHSHARRLGLIYENFLAAQLGLYDEYDFPEDYDVEDRESMLARFRRERIRISDAQSLLTWRQLTDAAGRTYPVKLHAVGRVLMENFNEFNKGYATVEEWVLAIGWRDRWMRRHIPKVLEEWQGNISDIIDSQRGHGCTWNL